uniref:Uncharacterized protein n=1 Tax=Knipowitschia caucasica TaxID=637954 RepID=A0AAV2IY73_KNICA
MARKYQLPDRDQSLRAAGAGVCTAEKRLTSDLSTRQSTPLPPTPLQRHHHSHSRPISSPEHLPDGLQLFGARGGERQDARWDKRVDMRSCAVANLHPLRLLPSEGHTVPSHDLLSTLLCPARASAFTSSA